MFDDAAMRAHREAQRRQEEARREAERARQAAQRSQRDYQRQQEEFERSRRLRDADSERAARFFRESQRRRHEPSSSRRRPAFDRSGARRGSFLRRIAVLAIAGLIAAAAYLAITEGAGVTRSTADAVSGRSTILLRVWSGPSRSTAVIGHVRRNQRVRIECRTANGWDRLVQPYRGAYVFDRYITRSEEPRRC